MIAILCKLLSSLLQVFNNLFLTFPYKLDSSPAECPLVEVSHSRKPSDSRNRWGPLSKGPKDGKQRNEREKRRDGREKRRDKREKRKIGLGRRREESGRLEEGESKTNTNSNSFIFCSLFHFYHQITIASIVISIS